MWIAIVIIFITLFARLIPHVPNFSPLVAVALFSGVYLKKRYSFLIPLSIIIFSDLIIGFHNTIIFTWGSVLLIYFLGKNLAKRKNLLTTVSYTLISSVLFFIITNFGVWLMGWYPRTAAGLLNCYIMAIPFFRTSLAANLIYVGIMFGIYEYFLLKKPVLLKQPLL